MDLRRASISLPFLALFLSSLACLGGLTPKETVDMAVGGGELRLTQDANTQTALQTEVSARGGPALLDLTEVKLTAHACAPHPDSTGFDCSFTAQFSIFYETTDWTRLQCYFSSQESDKTNVAAGVGQMSVAVTWASLFYAPGTKVAGFCQLRDQSSDELLAEDSLGQGPYDEQFFLPVP